MAKCPICKGVSSDNMKILPFCSNRCKDLDLHKWFSNSYSVPVVEYDDIPEEELEKLNALLEAEEEER